MMQLRQLTGVDREWHENATSSRPDGWWFRLSGEDDAAMVKLPDHHPGLTGIRHSVASILPRNPP